MFQWVTKWNECNCKTINVFRLRYLQAMSIIRSRPVSVASQQNTRDPTTTVCLRTAAAHPVLYSVELPTGYLQWIAVKAAVWQLQPKVVQCDTMSRMNISGYVGHVPIFSWMFSIACCLVVGLWLGRDLVSGWLVVMHTYLYTSTCAEYVCDKLKSSILLFRL